MYAHFSPWCVQIQGLSLLMYTHFSSHVFTADSREQQNSSLRNIWVMAHMWTSSDITYLLHIYMCGVVISHMNICMCICMWSHMYICMWYRFLPCYVKYVNESCHTFEWVISHMWMNHVTHANEAHHTFT